MRRHTTWGLITLALSGCGSQAQDTEYQRADLGPQLYAGVSPSAGPAQSELVPGSESPQAAAVEPMAGGAERVILLTGALPPEEPMPVSEQPALGDPLTGEAAIAGDVAAEEGATPEKEVDEVRSTTVSAADISAQGTCRMWLDVSDSSLLVEDVAVVVGDESWPATTSCGLAAEWLLTKDTDGTWLELCPAACEQLGQNPEAELTIQATYWTDVSPSVAR